MAPPRRRRSPPELLDDLIGEILLRLPPDEPANLIHAALVCKPWRRILFDPVFLRRYREFHLTPPLLGFLRFQNYRTKFVPTTTATPFSTLEMPRGHWRMLDCRHGRVLLYAFDPTGLGLVFLVWDPITGDQHRFRMPRSPDFFSAAVLCVADGCNRHDCRGGPFLVVFAASDLHEGVSWVSEYSSVTGAWSATTTVDFSASNNVGSDSYFDLRPSLFTGDAVYFVLKDVVAVVRYVLRRKSQSVIDTPDVYVKTGIVMVAEDGGLGFASVKDYNLNLWAWKVNTEGVAGWVQLRVIKLRSLFPLPKKYAKVIGFAEGTDPIVISTYDNTFTLNIKSRQVMKLGDALGSGFVLSYTSFYVPDLVGVRLPSP